MSAEVTEPSEEPATAVGTVTTPFRSMYEPLQDTLYFRLADASDIDQIFSLEVWHI